jgi:probable rRNA maturation factor
MNVEINNLTKFKINKKLFTGVAKKVFKGENKEIHNLSVAFVLLSEIQKLNKKYRNKNKPTDVLSFDYGEIVICPEVVKENAVKFGESFDKELLKVFVHGILHILGYEHEKSEKEAEKMESKQNFYLNNI